MQAAFELFGSIKHVQLHDGPAHAPKTTGPLILNYNYAIVIYRDKSSAVAACGAMNGVLVTLDKRVRAETLEVSFASGQASPESDDSDEELDETDKSLAQPDGPESDDMDLDGSDGDY